MVATGAFVTTGPHTAIFEFAYGAAGAEIISAKFFGQLFLSMNNAVSAFDMGFGRKPLPALTHYLKSSTGFRMSVFLT